MDQPVNLPKMALQAAVEPNSFNATARTFNVVWSTGARVRFQGFEIGAPELGEFDLTLGLAPENVDLDFARSGAPVLDLHRRASVQDVVGCVDRIDVDGQRGTATLRLSDRAEVAGIAADVEGGILRFVSIGTRLKLLRDITEEGDPVRHLFAELHEPLEVSLAPIPRDRGAVMQNESGERFAVQFIDREERGHDMPEVIDDKNQTKPGSPKPDTDILQAERERVDAIFELCEKAKMPSQMGRELVQSGKTLEQSRKIVLDRLAEQADDSMIGRGVGVGYDESELREQQIGHYAEALAARAGGPAPSPAAQQFVGYSLARIAEEVLRSNRQRVPTSTDRIVTQALHGTSDFPALLASSFDKRLRRAYDLAPSGVLSLAKESSAKDFRAKSILQIGEAPQLLKVGENSEFKRGSMSEAQESYKLETFGRIFGISRQALVNDDLGAFSQAAERFGSQARAFEMDFLASLLLSNPAMADGSAVFSAAHNNVASTGAAISVATLSAARLAIRSQRGLDGQTVIGLEPDVLLVPAALETTAQQLVASLSPAVVSEANPFSGLRLVVDPRLDAGSATAWYLVASQAEGLEYSFLDGARGVQIDSRAGFDVDGVEIRARLDFGAGVLDFRSWYRNAGA